MPWPISIGIVLSNSGTMSNSKAVMASLRFGGGLDKPLSKYQYALSETAINVACILLVLLEAISVNQKSWVVPLT